MLLSYQEKVTWIKMSTDTGVSVMIVQLESLNCQKKPISTNKNAESFLAE